MPTSTPLILHADRLFPAEPQVRRTARQLYESIQGLPIISPHGHVDPRWLSDDLAFPDPASLLISADHYVTRLLHASGVGLDELGVGQSDLSEQQARRAWSALCASWPVFRGTAVQEWLTWELVELFGVDQRPSAANADELYDAIAACLTEAEFRPRALYRRFGIDVIATTDDPCDDLDAHTALATDPSWEGRVIPTFRPDVYLEAGQPGWPAAVARLGGVSGIDTEEYDGYIRSLEARRRYFLAHGATSSDHSHGDVQAVPLEASDAARVYRAALDGRASAAETTAFRRHMLFEMARMSCDDSLVMTLHPGIRRNHHPATMERYGPNQGADIPVQTELTEALQPLLARFGTSPSFRLVLFSTDETVFSREVAPLAGFYPSLYAGAPWWFLDAPDAMRRYRATITETAGFRRTSGFVDDTRAFCSIPARHDLSRRIDCGVLAGLVAEHRLEMDEAMETATELVSVNPRRAFNL